MIFNCFHCGISVSSNRENCPHCKANNYESIQIIAGLSKKKEQKALKEKIKGSIMAFVLR
jgi:heterodisulfide reductase subunit C